MRAKLKATITTTSIVVIVLVAAATTTTTTTTIATSLLLLPLLPLPLPLLLLLLPRRLLLLLLRRLLLPCFSLVLARLSIPRRARLDSPGSQYSRWSRDFKKCYKGFTVSAGCKRFLGFYCAVLDVTGFGLWHTATLVVIV